jgi:hypothetical protein
VAPRRYAAISSSMRAGQGLCWTCLTGRGWPAQPRTSSIAQLSERLQARQKVRVEVPELHRLFPLVRDRRVMMSQPADGRCGGSAPVGFT